MEYLIVVAQGGGPLGGSWSRLPWLSCTSKGRKPKIRFLTSSPRKASWCLESRLIHHHSIIPPPDWGGSFSTNKSLYLGNDRRVGIFLQLKSNRKLHYGLSIDTNFFNDLE